MSYAIYLDGVRMPVNPEEFQVKDTRGMKEYDILNVGNVGLLQNRSLSTYEWTSEFPANRYSYCVSWSEASTYLNLIRESMSSNSPIELTVSNGTSYGISKQVVVTSFTTKEIEAGGYTYTITCKEYVEPMIIAQAVTTGYVRPAPEVKKATVVNTTTQSVYEEKQKQESTYQKTAIVKKLDAQKTLVTVEKEVRNTTWGSLSEYQEAHAKLTQQSWQTISNYANKYLSFGSNKTIGIRGGGSW